MGYIICVFLKYLERPNFDLVKIMNMVINVQTKLGYNAALVHFYCKFLLTGSKFRSRAISEVPAADPITPKREDEESTPHNWKIKMLYDGDCPLCMREVYF